MKPHRALGSLLLVAGVLACRHDRAPGPDSTAATPVVARTSAAPGAPACPRTGHWSECLMRARLEQSGLAPRTASDRVGELPALGVKPITLRVGNAGFALYLFADTLARHRAAATLDTATFIPQTRTVSMRAETTVIQNDNALALLFSRNEHQRERTADAITAGPPQP